MGRVLFPWLVFVFGCPSDIQVGTAQNLSPAAAIQSPTDGQTVLSDQAVEFVGIVSDSNGRDDISNVFWNSSVDGPLMDPDSGTPDAEGVVRLSVVLTPGNHAVTLTVADEAGAVGEDTITVIVEEERQEPTVTVDSPGVYQQALPGDEVQLIGTVADFQQPPQSLATTWEIEDTTTTKLVESLPSATSESGVSTATWTATNPGIYAVRLKAIDAELNEGTDEVLMVVADPGLLDQDGDGFTPSGGDCDDLDKTIFPTADETCGDLTDNDCNGEIDDKDADGDQHVDEECVNYKGLLPANDCDDADPFTYGGAYEFPDGVDNDCDGFVDNGGPVYDDDGDCFCEAGPCTGSIEPSCLKILEGDCDDEEVTVFPGADDVPDLSYTDHNCDGLDGDALDAVFVDPVGGADANTGLDLASPLLSLDEAYVVATAQNRSWVLLADGSTDMPANAFEEGIHLAGGYDANMGWSRSSAVVSEITVPASGAQLVGWTQPTEWQLLTLTADDANIVGGSSVGLWAYATSGFTLTECDIAAGNANGGADGINGVLGADGGDGDDGEDGCISTPCPTSPNACSTGPTRGAAGTGCSASFDGGRGGAAGQGNGGSGARGVDGDGVGGGSGGPGGPTNGDNGTNGDPGDPGSDGSPGVPGESVGIFSLVGGYVPDNGGNGSVGTSGYGGGGGGGGAGHQGVLGNCQSYGAAGGGGGGGGCGGGRGTGGRGGGASLGVVLTASSDITVSGGSITTGRGGAGGRGGDGAAGGLGGEPGLGGFGTGLLGAINPSGDGGDGGLGGDGGDGGDGGGGGGGPSIGISCRSSSTATITGTSFSVGDSGSGGASSSAPGADGLETDQYGC